MKKSKYSEEQIATALADTLRGQNIQFHRMETTAIKGIPDSLPIDFVE